MARKRHLSRIAVMQVLFERESREIDPDETLEINKERIGEIDEEFANNLLLGVLLKENGPLTKLKSGPKKIGWQLFCRHLAIY